MNHVRTLLLAMVVLGYGPNAFSSGIPTVDVANLTQAVQQYLNELEQYAEMMDQGATQQQELLNAVHQYEQMLTEYEHMLRQMEALENKVSARDWEGIYAMYEDIINSFPANEPDYSDPEWQETNEQVGGVYERGSELEQIEDEIEGMPYTADSQGVAMENTRQTYNRAQLITGQQMAVNENSKRLKQQMLISDRLDQNRLALGPESHLQTLQLLAEQNQAILDALHQQITVTNTELQYANQLDAHVYAKEQEGLQATRNEIQAEMGEPLTINEDPLVNF
ncbi:hypothetical protein RE428_48850 (plasmid) [Marinobacter nanhaiticus D15-8W]|uniref:Uncharacterized protein n=1 Tax=Marinobacter nanhaiticus D15-8W TaxID=626887 RepID=N6WA80_9GAMM|nr:hypothetical protein [Marinobacter nanhaiticus]ENO17139.1 hypothetical protein J057_00699 [Marinobacter nanhaiticus D15-8W]BES73867.1 hypothetical protein RE428_48850 [Marinobacter nanhaiticus D15-8W]